MAAYIVANVEVTDPVVYERYRARVPAVIAAHGGRYLVRGGPVKVLEGEIDPKRQVILEFPDMAALEAFYYSAEYQELVAIRQAAATGQLIAVQGV
jgi:uncharacterized protein (DUF1330 family)